MAPDGLVNELRFLILAGYTTPRRHALLDAPIYALCNANSPACAWLPVLAADAVVVVVVAVVVVVVLIVALPVAPRTVKFWESSISCVSLLLVAHVVLCWTHAVLTREDTTFVSPRGQI